MRRLCDYIRRTVAQKLDDGIDQLYQLPLDEFTAARNALAKDSGADGKAIKQLAKPPLAAWAVNQLYWKRRTDYESLIDAAAAMRKTHKAVIEGKSGDLRFAGREHELALEKALKATLALLEEGGQAVTEATRQAILNTLRALPSDEPPGRLSRPLTPGGFEMLAGIRPAKGGSVGPKVPGSVGPNVRGSVGPKVRESGGPKEQGTQGPPDLQRREAAERAIREAEHHARRAEFETARAVRDATKAEKRLADAREALEQAKEELQAAEREAKEAIRAREEAERKSRDAEKALQAARSRRG
jgi:hypothetical protein